MRKSYILLGALATSMAFAQEGRVGINTENPNATLEVAGQPRNASVVDGIIAPRLLGWQLRDKSAAYGADQKGAIVYVDTPPNIKDGKVRNVDSEGYYYFDGSVWVKFNAGAITAGAGGVVYTAGDNITISPDNVIAATVPTYTAGTGIDITTDGVISSTATSDNIYTADGTLTSARTVTMGNNTLKFTGENTTFEKTTETISLKSLVDDGTTYIGLYKNGGTARSGYIGYGASRNKNLTLQNSLGDVETAAHFRIGTVNLLTPLEAGNTITLADGSTSTTDRAVISQLGLLTLGANNIVRRTTGLELKVNSTANDQTLNLNDYVSISGNVNRAITHNSNIATNVITLPTTPETGRAMGRIYQLKNSKSVDVTTSVNYVGRNNVETNIIRPGQKVELVYVAGQVNKWVDISDKELPVGTIAGQTLQWNGTEWVAGTPTTYTAGNGITITDGVIAATAPANAVTSNIYTDNGTLAGNRTVTMANNNLNFAGGKIGVNASTPNATLDVNGLPGNATSADGLIAPRMSGPQMKAKTDQNVYGANQRGAIVYMTTAILDAANRTGALVNMDAPGYYYFDGSVWVKFRPETTNYTAGNGITITNGVIAATAPANAVTSNIYTANGTLAGNRTVTMSNNTLNFAGGNVGVSNATPQARLDIVSATQQRGFRLADGSQEDGKVLTTDNNGFAKWDYPVSPMNVLNIRGVSNFEIPQGSRNMHYTGVQVLVQPGKWMFTINLGVAHDALDSYRKGGTFLRLRWLSQEQATSTTISSDTNFIHPKAYGSTFASLGIPFNLTQGVLTGTLGINNDTGAPIRVYLYADTFATNEGYETAATASGRRTRLLFSWNESTMTSMEVR